MKPSEKLIQAIREREIQPAPKWRFTFKNGLLWSAFAIAALLGALAFSVILFAIQQADFRIINHLSHSKLELFLGLLPFFWIALLIIFLIIAVYSVQYSKKGYKFTAAKLAGYSAALSILMGTLFFISGGAQRLEQAFALQLSIYESVQERKVILWSRPQDGYLSGQIMETAPEYFRLQDFENNAWTIFYENAFMPPVVLLEKGEKIKLIGKISDKNQFVATEIRPWGGMGNQRRNRGR